MHVFEGFQGKRTIIHGYIAFLLCALIAAGVLLIKHGRNWGYGDWLINYEGGFVRRGLMGEICLQIAHWLHLDPLYVVAAIGISCYAVLFYCVWRLLTESSWNWWVIGLLVCPATLAFPVISRTSFRKEILFFAFLGSLIVWLQEHGNDRSKDKWLSLWLCVALPVLILSHEPLVAYFPYVAAALLICIEDVSRVAFILTVPALLSGLAVVEVLTHIGNTMIVRKVCSSLGDQTLSTCSEAVQTLAQTQDEAARYVAGFIERFHYYRQYGIDVALASIPLIGAYRSIVRRPNSRRSLTIVLGAICLSVPLSISLFHYGVDWGRWIQMHMMSLFLLILLIDARREMPETSTPPKETTRLKPAMACFLFLYATCWSMPGVKDRPHFGYVSHAERLMHWNGSLTSQ